MGYLSVEGRSRHNVLIPDVAGGAARGIKRPCLLGILHGGIYLRCRSGVGVQGLLGALVLWAPEFSSVQ